MGGAGLRRQLVLQLLLWPRGGTGSRKSWKQACACRRGCKSYWMLCGMPDWRKNLLGLVPNASSTPFAANTAQAMCVSILADSPARFAEVAPDVPAGLAELIERALSKDRAERYADVSHFAAVLRRARRAPTSSSRS